MATIIHSREGVTQGYPLDMISYSIGVITLTKRLNLTYPDVTQPWCAGNAGALGTFDNLEQYFNLLKCNRLDQGYLPDPTKVILFMHTKNLKAGELFVRCHGFKVCTGTRYLGGYIGDEKSKGDWIKKQTEKWERDICALIKTVDKYTQESYATVACAVQSECIFLQLVMKDTIQAFTGMEKVLW